MDKVTNSYFDYKGEFYNKPGTRKIYFNSDVKARNTLFDFLHKDMEVTLITTTGERYYGNILNIYGDKIKFMSIRKNSKQEVKIPISRILFVSYFENYTWQIGK